MPKSATTPMFRQYQTIKAANPDAILLYRMGDFYEMFFDDAKTASRDLELTLTARGKGTDKVVPMCGFPHHQLDGYAARLLRAGHRVAVCDQTEDPKKAKGLVRREVVRVLTPGTAVDAASLPGDDNLWAAAVARAGGRLGAAFLDASTGEFLAWDTGDDDGALDALFDRLRAFGPREIVHGEAFAWPDTWSAALDDAVVTPTEPYAFAYDAAAATLARQFDVATLDGFGLADRPGAVAAAGGLLTYLLDAHRSGLEHVDGIALHDPARHVLLDPATRRNLELDRNLRDGGKRGSLLDVIDGTRTSSGARRLRAWLHAPLIELDAIEERLDAVDEAVGATSMRDAVRDALDGVHDIERLTARAVAGTANPRELGTLGASLGRLPDLAGAVADARARLVRRAIDGLDPCSDVRDLLESAIAEEAPATVRDGGVIRDGFDDELDELRAVGKDGRAFLASLEAREREATGIASLKVRFNKVFGYFIEVSKANLHLVPDHYHRKQTIAGGERFITPELKEHEHRILHAQERILALESALFERVRRAVADAAPRLKAAASVVALLDVVAGLAETAVRRDYRRPEVHDGRSTTIENGRHPVVEATLVDRRFVPNDVGLDAEKRPIAILTGPNMGGKSTYLRQTALITLLAQVGSFVPAAAARIGVVDRAFCRVGASDNLTEGQSTFMVEMAETANILHHATARSLVVLDEIGRGTATFDGLSIAWAVVEHLLGADGGAPRTLFATHYHELTELAAQHTGVQNLRMAVRERGDSIAFTHRVERGAADRSYGIHVARLAGVPKAVVRRAEEILHNLEADAYGRDGLPRLARSPGGHTAVDPRQGNLFPGTPDAGRPESRPSPEAARLSECLAELRGTDLDDTTPRQAWDLLARWRSRWLDE